MGLFEKARHLADARLRALTEPGGSVPDEVLRRAILELDGYRRELGQQLAKHRREEEQLLRSVSERSAGLALWQARRVLAHESGRADLVDAATRRAERERTDRDLLEKRRATIQAAVANLTVNLEKVDRTVRLLRTRKRATTPSGRLPARGASDAAPHAGADVAQAPAAEAAPRADAPARSGTSAPGGTGEIIAGGGGNAAGVPSALDDPVLAGLETPLPEGPADPIEAEFQHLEHEEVVKASAAIASRREGRQDPPPTPG